MNCEKCSLFNPQDAKFCNQCGTVLNRPCPRCGTTNTLDSKFCKQCAADLNGGTLEQAQASIVSVPEIRMNKLCPVCHTVNEAASSYCYKCGIKLLDQAISSTQIAATPAGFWIRLAAFSIDGLALGLFSSLVILLFTNIPVGEAWSQLFGSDVSWKTQVISEFIGMAYYTFSIGKWGQTLGKALTGLKVTRLDGTRITYWRSFARYLSYYLSFLTLGLGFLFIAFSSRKRGLHDHICDTQVIKLFK